jgi:hypothetical protein
MERARPEPPDEDVADERRLLEQWLAFHRDVLEATCAGLTGEQLALRSAPPSDLSLLAVVRHLTEVELVHLALPLAGEEPAPTSGTNTEPVPAERALRTWRDVCARSNETLAALPSVEAVPWGRANARWRLLKVLGEYARHNGHADLLRQAIDGGRQPLPAPDPR